MIYLDNAATTAIDPEVLDAMLPWLREHYGNPGGLYSLGREAAAAVENARAQVAELLGSEPDQVIFTSGGSEGNSLVFSGLRSYLETAGRKRLLVSAIEHESVMKAAEALCAEHGFDLHFIRPSVGGLIQPADVRSGLESAGVGLVSVMLSNNETGVTHHCLPKLSSLSHSFGALFHTDAVQAAGFMELRAAEMNCDFMTVSSHKLHGPKGVGALYAKDKTLLKPLVHGGAFQEFGLRGGTENVAGIVGFGKACMLAARDLAENRMKIEKAAMAFLTALATAPSAPCVKNGFSDIVNNKTISLRFDGVDAETLVLALDAHGVCASAGSACNSREQEPSHVLTAMGLTPDQARSSVRFSFSKYTSEEDAVQAAGIVADCVRGLRRQV